MVYSPIMPSMKLSAQDMGVPDYQQALQNVFKNVQGAYDTAYKPKTMAEALLHAQMQNKIDQPKADDAQGWYDVQKAYHQALTNQANRPPQLSGDVGLLDYLIKNKDKINEFGSKDSSGAADDDNMTVGQKIYHNLVNKAQGIKAPNEYSPSNTGKELQEYSDAKAGFVPHTNRKQQFASPEEQQDYLDAYAVKTTGLKKGSHYVTGENGERIGETRPMSPKERDTAKGTSLFNTFYPIINKGLNRYSGKDSIKNLEEDASKYNTDPKARERFDQFLIAQKLSTLATVTEAARFGAGKQNQVFNRFNESLSSFDVPKKIASLIKQYQIPASANIRNGMKFQQILNKGEDDYKKGANPNITEYYPGKAPSAQHSYTPKEIAEEAKYFNTSEKNIEDGIKAGITTEEEMRDWLRGLQ